MKQLISVVLLLAVIFSFAGCQEEAPLKDPVNFYYRRIQTEFGKETGVIDVMVVEGDGKKGDHLAMLNQYLLGINNSSFASTFPVSTQVTDLRILGDTAFLTLNPALGQYSGMDLTIACACLTLTTMELTGTQQVSIRITSGTLNGSDQIIMDRNTILLLDIYQPDDTTQTR